MPKINTVLVANRGEIAIRVFRACNELGIRTVAIYSKEDTLSLHRNKADEAYMVGEGKSPTDAYLDIEDILRVAKEHDVDAIHPGYGFLSENSNLARRCAEEGLIFIGPRLEHLVMFGDKINARKQAELAGIPMIPGSKGTVNSLDEVLAFGEKCGYPIIIKAVNGGGGRGMRVVHSAEEAVTAYDMAKSEAKKAFGNDEIYLEKYLLTILGALTFKWLIPLSMLALAVYFGSKKELFWKIGVKIFIFGLAIYAVIPVSVHVSKMIYSTYQESIDATIDEANDLADESEAAKDDDKDSKKSKESESSFIDKAKDAVNSVKNTLSVTADSVKNMVNKFIDGLAVLIVTTCLIPVLVIVFFIWLVKLVLGSAISSPGAVAMRRGKDK